MSGFTSPGTTATGPERYTALAARLRYAQPSGNGYGTNLAGGTTNGGRSMARRVSVYLPFGKEPAFPDRCISCGAPHPDLSTAVALSLVPDDAIHGEIVEDERSIGPPLDRPTALVVPCCDRCNAHVRAVRGRWETTFEVVGMAAAALAVLAGVSHSFPQLPHRGFFILLAIGLAIPVVFARRLFPPAVEAIARPGGIMLMMSDQEYAREVASLNAMAGSKDQAPR
jgi:hypothetical protein